jgi:hypothetical protein
LAEFADSTNFDSNKGLGRTPGRLGLLVPASVENPKQPSSSQPCFAESGIHVQADGKTVPSLADERRSRKVPGVCCRRGSGRMEMLNRVMLIVVSAVLAQALGAVCCAQTVRAAIDSPMSAGGLPPAVAAGSHWTAAGRQRWLWYSPQQWQFPAYLRPPVLFSLDTGLAPRDTWYADPFGRRELDMSRSAIEPPRTTRPERRTPQAYQWNEATGQAEPVELQRWGDRGGNEPVGDGL